MTSLLGEPSSTRFFERFSSLVDLRSLALMRICCGLICLFDVANRSVALRAQYTADGVLPLRNYLWQPDLSWRIWSVFYIGDSPFVVLCLFAVMAVLASFLVLGYRVRLTSVGLWVLVLSLHHRNILVLNGGDHYLRALLFWGMFLPWGARFSLDSAVLEFETDNSMGQRTPAGIAYLVQVCMVYGFNALYKTSPAWRSEGTAIYDALQLSDIGNGLGRQMARLGSLLEPMTFGVWYVEFLATFVLLLPYARARMLAIGVLALFHLGILASMSVEIYSIVAIVALLGLLPGSFWDLAPCRGLALGLNRAYQALSRHLSLGLEFGTGTSGVAKVSSLENGFVILALAFVVFQSSHDYLTRDRWKDRLGYGRVLGLYVKWSMFAPGPPNDAWQSAPAVTASGLKIDLLTNAPPSSSKLKTVAGYEHWGRWRSYRSSIAMGGVGGNSQAYLDFLVGRWNSLHSDDPVVSAKYVLYREGESRDYRLPSVHSVLLATSRGS